MTGKKIWLLSLIVFYFACNKNREENKEDDEAPCVPMICTLEARSVGITFVDNTGQPVTVTSFHAVNTRTGLGIKYTGATVPNRPGYYVIAGDGDKSELSTGGDDVLVSGVNPATNQLKNAIVKLGGGCNCHVAKYRGQIKFNLTKSYSYFNTTCAVLRLTCSSKIVLPAVKAAKSFCW